MSLIGSDIEKSTSLPPIGVPYEPSFQRPTRRAKQEGAYPDPNKHDPKLVVFDIAPVNALSRPVTLKEIKANPKFAGWDLVRLPSLSVVKVSETHWAEIERMAKV